MSSSFRILRRVRKEFDFESYLEEHHQIKRTARTNELRICCPHCAETKYKCYVNTEKRLFNCYKCDFNSGHYDVFDFVALSENISRGVAMKRLAQEYASTTPLTMEEVVARLQGEHLEVEEDEDGPTSDIRTIEALPEEAFSLTSPEGSGFERKFWKYLVEDRGLTPKEVTAAKIHYVPAAQVPIYKEGGDGELKYVGDIGRRILFPVYGPGGKLVSWLTRPITSDHDGPKYINCPNSEVNRTLWPFVPPHEGAAVLVEGIFDCMATRRLGPPFSAYATFGKKVSHDQIQHLKNWGVEEVTVFWDPDAKSAIIRAVEELKMHFKVYVPDFSQWPQDADAGEMMQSSDGIIHLENALCNPIDVDTLAYTAWQIQ